ncbi:MAG: M28 family peptidase, partial [Oscillospiraceae bacterium]
VTPNVTACNITGAIDGISSDAMVLLSAHYDSYFQGFQDDNTAVGMMLSIAKAIKEAHLRPRKTLVFCAMAAEEWGACNTQYDWSTGAYNQIFRIHPEWVGKAIVDINLELPARRHAKRHMIRSVFEYKPFLKAQLQALPPRFASLYPNGVGIISPVQSWSDDFSMALAGVPSMVNEFGTGSFMETHYHSQFDNDSAYDREAYEFHHRLYSRLLLAFDGQMLPPLHFGPRLEAMGETLTDQNLPPSLEGAFRTALDQALQNARALYRLTERLNAKQRELLLHDPAAAAVLDARMLTAKKLLLTIFHFCQTHFVALDWYDEAMLPHEIFQYNIDQLRRAVWQLAANRGADAFSSLCNVDNNR